MFKRASFEDEIRQSMEKQLVSSQVEQQHGFNKLAKAMEYLQAASEIFQNAEMSDVSQDIDQVLQSLVEAVK